MGEVAQIITVQNGYTGAPGYSSHFFFGDPMSPSSVNSAVAAVRAYWFTIRTLMGGDWSASINLDVSILDEATGDLLRVQGATDPGAVAGPGSAGHAGGVGACSSWGTAAVHGTRRLRGRTFIVPLAANQYESNGTIVGSSLTQLRDATTTLAAVANFGVWGRPRDAYTDEDGDIHPALTGEWAACTSGTVKDKVAILRSRRD
jgi:hypothetical protein